MKEQSRYGCVAWGGFVFVLLFLLILSVGGWWFFRLTANTAETQQPASVFVFLLTPADGDEVKVGDPVLVSLNVFGLHRILSAELFVNGASLGVVRGDPENAHWTWRPLSPGIYTLTARATDMHRQVGHSQTILGLSDNCRDSGIYGGCGEQAVAM